MRLLSTFLLSLIISSSAFSQIAVDTEPDTIAAPPVYESVLDSLMAECIVTDTVISMAPLPRQLFMPAVFTSYALPPQEEKDAFSPEYSGKPYMRWVEDAIAQQLRQQSILQRMMLSNPHFVRYNYDMLPEAPKEYIAIVNPEDHTISINEITANIDQPTIEATAVKKKHWLRVFKSSLQFSEAYVSPNWYQGGNDNVNALLDLYYNVKLNPAFHPKWLFETTFQYKLGINNAPEDTVRKYNVSTDVLQINTLLGLKAANNWYYSITGQFKTQVVNSYASNSDVLRSAWLSPGDLTLGLGMTYNRSNEKKTFLLDVSINPLSYNLSMCVSNRMNAASFGIDPGKHFHSAYGSNMDCKLTWQICETVSLNSRLTGFTNYDRAYADWENTLAFRLTKFMTAQIYANMRYDSDTPVVEGEKWKKFQIKEILSIGFTYNFSTL